jgi:hypothetical protein
MKWEEGTGELPECVNRTLIVLVLPHHHLNGTVPIVQSISSFIHFVVILCLFAFFFVLPTWAAPDLLVL